MRLWEQIKKILSPVSPEKKEPCEKVVVKSDFPEEGELLSHELIQRSESDKQYYAQWEASSAKDGFLDWLYKEYQHYRQNGCCDPALMFLIIPSVNGFVIRFDAGRWHDQDFICLFDYFKSSLKKEGYWPHVSDVKTIKKCTGLEEVQRHYLKPPRQFELECGEKMDQKFGNLMISLCVDNGHTCTLKLSATHYNDRLYDKAYPFDDLMNLLCS